MPYKPNENANSTFSTAPTTTTVYLSNIFIYKKANAVRVKNRYAFKVLSTGCEKDFVHQGLTFL